MDIELLFQAICRIEDRVLTAISQDGMGRDPSTIVRIRLLIAAFQRETFVLQSPDLPAHILNLVDKQTLPEKSLRKQELQLSNQIVRRNLGIHASSPRELALRHW